MKPRVAILRAEWLNPFELQSYEPLLDRFDLVAIGSRHGPYDVHSLQMPVIRLRERGSGPVSRRLLGDRAGRLRGLDRPLRSCALVHSAETFLPITEQAVELRARHRFKLVSTCWEVIPFLHEDEPHLAERKRLAQEAVDVFLAVTEAARQALVSEGVPDGRIKVQPVGVDRRVFRPADRDESLVRSWNIPDGWSTVLYCGRLVREKGVLDLIQALVSLPRTILVLAGVGPERARLESAAHILRVADRLRFVGGVEYAAMPRLYASCDAFCLPSVPTPYWQEQFGMVLVEAMACGTPIVTTATGAIPEVVGEAALVTPPYSPQALADALARLHGDPELRATLVESGLERAAARFDAAKVSESVADVYRELLE